MRGKEGTCGRIRLAGQGLVEAAVCIPLLAALLFVGVSGAQAYRVTMLAETASAEGARYATQHVDATDEQIASWVRASIGATADNCAVEVTRSGLDDQDYTMRVTDSMGGERAADAKTTRVAVTVRVTLPDELIGFSGFETHASHTGIQSTEGVAR